MKHPKDWLFSKAAKLEAMEWGKTTIRGRIVYTRWLYLWAVVYFPMAFLRDPAEFISCIRRMIQGVK